MPALSAASRSLSKFVWWAALAASPSASGLSTAFLRSSFAASTRDLVVRIDEQNPSIACSSAAAELELAAVTSSPRNCSAGESSDGMNSDIACVHTSRMTRALRAASLNPSAAAASILRSAALIYGSSPPSLSRASARAALSLTKCRADSFTLSNSAFRGSACSPANSNEYHCLIIRLILSLSFTASAADMFLSMVKFCLARYVR